MVDYTSLSQRKYGEERTPGGSPRYLFWFGVEGTSFILYKLKAWRSVGDPPACVLMSFTLKDFVKQAKEVGLHISKAERDKLTKEHLLQLAN